MSILDRLDDLKSSRHFGIIRILLAPVAVAIWFGWVAMIAAVSMLADHYLFWWITPP